MKNLGVAIGGLGALIAVFALFVFDTSVSTGYGRVNNVGLMADRQNLLIVGCALLLIGVAVVLFASKGATAGTAARNEQADRLEGNVLREFTDAIKKDDDGALRALLRAGRVTTTQELPPTGRGVLQYSVGMQAAKCTAALIESGARPHDVDGLGESALVVADKLSNDAIRAVLSGDPPAVEQRPRQSEDSSSASSEYGLGHPDSIAADLARLVKLKEAGHLSEDEFGKAKARLLGA